MKKLTYILLILILGFMFAVAGTYEHRNGGVSIWFPDNWRVTMDGDVLEAEAPTQDAFAQLLTLDVNSLQEAVNVYMNEMSGIMRNFRVTSEVEDMEWNGLRVYYVEGEGRIQGVDFDTSVSLIQSNRAVVMMVTFNTEEAGKRNRHLYKQIVRSIQAI
ncbi:MAG: hypothetical protein GY950_15420 [bacterium]|nr:hypothetical protein [bacterium]